jgi:hypothetical protein
MGPNFEAELDAVPAASGKSTARGGRLAAAAVLELGAHCVRTHRAAPELVCCIVRQVPQ